MIGPEAVAGIDELETGFAGVGGPYVTVVSLDGRSAHEAQAYVAREPARWQALVDVGGADALTAYTRLLAAGETLRRGCLRTPGHAPPHDVIDPLDNVTGSRA